ncbi:hypothetical protein ACTQ3M_04650 [Oscillospiraceae bacterium LCP25S3_E10]|nr:hypothetical protein [Ruminococcus sp.]MDD6447494.1 hypothetical protein [Ruminococcus sp.]MDY2856421.1 hypothetical protein [Oscillospiraceae bacterium]
MIKCPNCGFENDDSCTFCAICGSPVIDNSFYVHNTAKQADISVDDLNKMLITQGAKTKSFTKLDKAALNKAKAALANRENYVKKYSKSTDNSDNAKAVKTSSSNRVKQTSQISGTDSSVDNSKNQPDIESRKDNYEKTKSANNTQQAQNLDTKSFAPESGNAIIGKELPKSAPVAHKTNSNTATKNISVPPTTDDNAGNKSTPVAHTAGSNTVNKNISDSYTSSNAANAVTESPISAGSDSKLFRLISKMFFGTKDETNRFKQEDIENNSALAVLSYIPFMFFIPMIIKPTSGYLRYHGIQGLTMFLTFVGLEFVDVLLCAIANAAVPGAVGSYISIAVTLIANLCVLLLIAIGIANAVKGYARELPIIGKIKLLKQ